MGVAAGVAALLKDDDDVGALDVVPLFDGVFEHPAINAVAKSPVTRKDSGRGIYRLSSSGVQCKRCARSATPARPRPPAKAIVQISSGTRSPSAGSAIFSRFGSPRTSD